MRRSTSLLAAFAVAWAVVRYVRSPPASDPSWSLGWATGGDPHGGV